MKLIDINETSKMKLAISDVSVIKQTNLWSVCQHPDGRIYNGFLLISSGECVYEWEGGHAPIAAGSLIYLPKGSRHAAYASERSIEFYRINFSLTDAESGEEVLFSDSPLPITDSAPHRIFELCEELRRLTLLPDAGFKSHALIAELLDYTYRAKCRVSESRISAAVDYIDNHATEEIPVSLLADLCFLSEAHLFRLFKSQLGMSPIEYKNAIRIKKAESLLADRELSIAEIAEMLGFENACYFSRIFKSRTGRSPIAYRKYIV